MAAVGEFHSSYKSQDENQRSAHKAKRAQPAGMTAGYTSGQSVRLPVWTRWFSTMQLAARWGLQVEPEDSLQTGSNAGLGSHMS